MTARERVVGSSSCGIFREQDERGVLRRLFQQLEKAVGRLLHKRRGGEDGEGALGFGGLPVIRHVNRLAHLAELDHQLRRVGRNDEHVGMGLHEDARLALVGVAHVIAGGNGFGHERVEVGGRGDARAVAANAAKVGQAIGFCGIEAVDGLGQHEGERVFARAARAGQDHGVRKTAGAHAFAQVRDGGRVAEEILKAHGMRVTGSEWKSGVSKSASEQGLRSGSRIIASVPIHFRVFAEMGGNVTLFGPALECTSGSFAVIFVARLRGGLRTSGGERRMGRQGNESFGLSAADLRTLRALKTPARIQKFIDALEYQYADTAGSPRRVLRERKGHCLEGALVAAAALRVMGIRRW